MRYPFSLLLLVLLCCPLCAAKKNIVLVVADDLGQDLGCYGNKVIKTPNLDALAKDGTRFRHAFATTASCSASRSVILTGLHNHANGQYGHEHAYHHFRVHDRIRSLPAYLADAGYRTARIGKFHVGPEEVFKFGKVLPGNARNPVRMAEACKEFVAARDERPFFLYFCTADPHRSGDFADDLPGKPNRFGNRPQGYPDVKEQVYSPKNVIVPPWLPDNQESRAELAQYYQSISRVDQGLGRLVQILKDAGQWDNTLLIFTSDHGAAFPGAKTTTYEPGLLVPLIVRDPTVKKRGIVSDALVSLVDLTPTIVAAAGVRPTGTPFHGRSFLSILGEDRPRGWDEVFCSHTFHEITMYFPMRVVRERKYKLIWNIASGLPFPFASDLWAAPTWQSAWKQGKQTLYGKRTVGQYIKRPAFELYDLEADPHEIKNLAADPRHARELERLKARLKEFQKKTGDPWVSKWEYE
jgi:N-sulfoglucosamine sulfohydrolase